PARRRLVLVLRRLGAARAAVAALGAAAGAAPRALCRLARRRAPGRGARGLVVAPLALRRDRQAAGAAAAAVAARPSLRHGLAVAGHRRRDCGVDATADALPADRRRTRAACAARARGRAPAAALVSPRVARFRP